MNIKYQIKKETLNRILALYKISDFEYQEAKGGIANTTVFVTTDKQELVLRVYKLNAQSDNQILEEIEFSSFLKSKNILVPVFLPNINGDYLSKITLDLYEWQVALMFRIKGKMVSDFQWLEPNFIKEISKVQAKLHLAGIEFGVINNKQEYNKDVTASGIGIMLKERLCEVINLDLQDKNLLKIIQNIQSPEQKYQLNLPAGYIHDDIYGRNLILQDQKIYIIDFGDLRFGPLVSCLGCSLFETFRLGHLDGQNIQKLFEEYLLHYGSIRKVTNQELDEIKKAVIVSLELYIVSEILEFKTITNNLQNLLALKAEILDLKIRK